MLGMSVGGKEMENGSWNVHLGRLREPYCREQITTRYGQSKN